MLQELCRSDWKSIQIMKDLTGLNRIDNKIRRSGKILTDLLR